MAKHDIKWDKAKQLAREQNRVNDWAFVLELYRQLGGNNQKIVGVSTELDNKTFRIIGMASSNEALVLSNEAIVTLNNDIVKRSKKTFSTFEDKETEDVEYPLPDISDVKTFEAYNGVNKLTIRKGR